MVAECRPIAVALDAAARRQRVRDALQGAGSAWQPPRTLPSARVLDSMAREHAASHNAFVLARSEAIASELRALPLDPQAHLYFGALAEGSIAEQRYLEANDSVPFEVFLEQYLDPQRLG